jgi:DNA polymerase
VVIHNSHFDRTVIRHALGIDISTSRIHDTMAQALSHGLPGSLGMLCEILGLPTDKAKDKDGQRLIQIFTKPLGKNRLLRRATREHTQRNGSASKPTRPRTSRPCAR